MYASNPHTHRREHKQRLRDAKLELKKSKRKNYYKILEVPKDAEEQVLVVRLCVCVCVCDVDGGERVNVWERVGARENMCVFVCAYVFFPSFIPSRSYLVL